MSNRLGASASVDSSLILHTYLDSTFHLWLVLALKWVCLCVFCQNRGAPKQQVVSSWCPIEPTPRKGVSRQTNPTSAPESTARQKKIAASLRAQVLNLQIRCAGLTGIILTFMMVAILLTAGLPGLMPVLSCFVSPWWFPAIRFLSFLAFGLVVFSTKPPKVTLNRTGSGSRPVTSNPGHIERNLLSEGPFGAQVGTLLMNMEAKMPRD